LPDEDNYLSHEIAGIENKWLARTPAGTTNAHPYFTVSINGSEFDRGGLAGSMAISGAGLSEVQKGQLISRKLAVGKSWCDHMIGSNGGARRSLCETLISLYLLRPPHNELFPMWKYTAPPPATPNGRSSCPPPTATPKQAKKTKRLPFMNVAANNSYTGPADTYLLNMGGEELWQRLARGAGQARWMRQLQPFMKCANPGCATPCGTVVQTNKQ
jgi:hypothetical protein